MKHKRAKTKVHKTKDKRLPPEADLRQRRMCLWHKPLAEKIKTKAEIRMQKAKHDGKIRD